jgi:hypothetical protein
MRGARRVGWRGLALLALLLAGCGKQEATAVMGRVTFQGQPLTDGAIVFAPDPDRNGAEELAIGLIQPDGRYQLRTAKGPVVAAGWYRITIISGGDPRLGGWPILPPHLRDPAQSGLKRQIKRGGNQEFDFAL